MEAGETGDSGHELRPLLLSPASRATLPTNILPRASLAKPRSALVYAVARFAGWLRQAHPFYTNVPFYTNAPAA